MPGKMLSCSQMRSDNLKNHIKRHGDVQHATSYQSQPGHKRPSSSSQLLPIQRVSPVKNPIRQKSTREKSSISKALKNPPVLTPPNLPKKLVPLVVDNENSLEINEEDPNLQAVNPKSHNHEQT